MLKVIEWTPFSISLRPSVERNSLPEAMGKLSCLLDMFVISAGQTGLDGKQPFKLQHL